jgi:hypothetical protein
MVHIIQDSSDLLHLSDFDIQDTSPTFLCPIPINDLSNIKHVTTDKVDSLHSNVNLPNETVFLPNPSTNHSIDTTILFD